ncbi:hypothetical protein ACP275_01G075200 [Erythranthe tilingii]
MADQLVADMEDWSLQAIVRGSSGDYAKIADTEMDGHDSFFDNHGQFDPREFLSSSAAGFPEMFAGSSEELQELYKPFYHPAAVTTTTSTSPPVQTGTVLDFQQDQKLQNILEDDSKQKLARVSPAAAYTPKYKKRKNQHKRVVVQVSAEGLASDMWAWRKYGQKPIKGSPFPRSYYRCSSSKGCLARKQVEESCTDPGKFIITYTAEHSHSQPTRRNSLAGTVRQKFPSPSSKTTPNNNISRPAKQDLKAADVAISPPPPPMKTLADDHHEARIKEEMINRQEKEAVVEEDGGDFMASDFVFNEEFFSGLEDFDQFMAAAELPGCHATAQQFPVRSCSRWF